ncbi:hypothetical protein E2I00_009237 [Balaenoptera physalus]|uniref:Amidohydrolase-related domain-containing protein n=1 Tax=Balaenoptera physalus TaxID=9770 RepID=A0A6A1Q2T8_BALPH|nr:hypothetical protein E2I00_009237 [Balaenoptera physalus]
MRGGQGAARAPVIQFTNCRILRGRALLREDLWVRGGSILDPEKLFFEERRVADEQRDCGGCILAPGFIDVQINGGFGVDFSQATEDVGSGVALVARRILPHGVTSFCPTLVTSPPEVYRKFHHRDPGIVGLLTSDRLPLGRHIFYGMIADGIHTNPAALRIAHRAHPEGLVLVTDAVPALGLGNGRHTLGQQEVEVDGLTAYVAGCSVESALEAASLHPAQLLGLEKHKGTLDFGADAVLLLGPQSVMGRDVLHKSCAGPWFPAPGPWGGDGGGPAPACFSPPTSDPDFVVLDDSLHVRATYISGELVWQAEEARQ